jgi:hypothetical protein
MEKVADTIPIKRIAAHNNPIATAKGLETPRCDTIKELNRLSEELRVIGGGYAQRMRGGKPDGKMRKKRRFFGGKMYACDLATLRGVFRYVSVIFMLNMAFSIQYTEDMSITPIWRILEHFFNIPRKLVIFSYIRV